MLLRLGRPAQRIANVPRDIATLVTAPRERTNACRTATVTPAISVLTTTSAHRVAATACMQAETNGCPAHVYSAAVAGFSAQTEPIHVSSATWQLELSFR